MHYSYTAGNLEAGSLGTCPSWQILDARDARPTTATASTKLEASAGGWRELCKAQVRPIVCTGDPAKLPRTSMDHAPSLNNQQGNLPMTPKYRWL